MRDITLGETFYHFFTTRSFATGVPTQLAGTPVLSVLEENNATPITSGVSVSVDRGTVTGLNQATIVASGANGYEAGKSYAIYVSTGTVGGVSVVGEVVGEFTVQASAAFTRLGAPAGASVSADILAIDNFVDDIESRLGTPSNLGSGATVAANLVDIENQTDDIGVAGAGLTNIGTIATVTTLTNLPAITANWLTAAGIATGAIDADALATDAVTEITDATKTALGIVSGTADSGTTTTMVDAALTQADTDYWKGALIVFTSGTISGQARLVTGFTPGTDTIAFAPATTQAVGTNTYILVPKGRVDVELWDGAAVNALTAGRVDVTVGAMQADTVTAAALAADAVTEIQTGLATPTNITAGTITTATNVTTVNGLAANVITAASIANAAIDAATFAADVDAEILSYLVDDATRIDASALNTASVTTIPAILVDTAEIGAAGAGLTNINLPNQTMDIVGNITGNVSGSVGSVTGNVGGNVVGEVASIGASGIAAASFAAAALNAIADTWLDRNMAAGADNGTDSTAVRTPRQSLRASRNKVTIAAGVVTVTKEDDLTTSWTAALTTAAGNPISGVDPT